MTSSAVVRAIGTTALAVAVGLCGGCSVSTGVQAVAEPVPPAEFHQTQALGGFVDERWWTAFDDATLNQLMGEAFARNLTLQAALARLDQYSALVRTARANRVPQVDVAAERSSSTDNANASDESGGGGGAWSINVTTGYELDLWGKLRAGRQSAYADLLATREDTRAAVLAISAEVAAQYFTLVALRQQQALLRETIGFYADNFAFVEGRYRRGTAESLDLYQAQTVLADARAQLSVVDGDLILVEHALSTLLGRYPETGWVAGAGTLPEALPPLAPGLPADLVVRRPDVRAAHHAMEAADRRTAEAIAGRLPGVSLTTLLTGALGGPASAATLVANMVLGAVQPIFRGGALRADEERARAAWTEALATYRLVLLTAFKEVENALAQERSESRTLGHLVDVEESSREALRFATFEFLAGTADYLQVIFSQTTHLSASREVISARLRLVGHRVQLAAALGGRGRTKRSGGRVTIPSRGRGRVAPRRRWGSQRRCRRRWRIPALVTGVTAVFRGRIRFSS